MTPLMLPADPALSILSGSVEVSIGIA